VISNAYSLCICLFLRFANSVFSKRINGKIKEDGRDIIELTQNTPLYIFDVGLSDSNAMWTCR
jgi:hypothetical protein